MTSAVGRWLLVPWRDAVLIVALISATATPAFLVATAGVWRVGAADAITELLVAEGPDSDRLISVETEAFFAAEPTQAASQAVSQRLSEVPGTGTPVRTLSTPRGLATTGPDEPPLTVPVRLVNHGGAIETVDYVRHLPDEFFGAWISDWMAERYDLQIGDTFAYISSAEPEVAGAETVPGGAVPGGAVAELLIVGIYEKVWTEDGSLPPSDRGIDVEEFLDGIPPGLVPTYLTPFRAPSFALVFVDDPTMESLGVTGTARWTTEIVETPQTRQDLGDVVGEVRSLERSLVRDEGIRSAIELQSGPGRSTPTVISSLPTTLNAVDRQLDTLAQPFRATQAAGASIGLFVMIGAAAFAVSRRRQEFALLAAEGDRWEHFAGRAAMQFVAPTVAGTTIGLGLATVAGARLGPSAAAIDLSAALDTLDWERAVVLAMIGLVVASAVTGLIGQRSLDHNPLRAPSALRRSAMLGLGLAVVAFGWVQVGNRPADGDSVDLTLLGFPIVTLAVSIVIVMFIVEFVTSKLSSRLSRLGPVGFLAWRRISQPGATSRVVIAALGISLGLFGLSSLMTRELDRAASVSLFTEVGSETLVDLVGRPDGELALPPQSTIVGFEETRITPGSRPVRIVAIDPSSAADALAWPDDLSLSFDDAVELLASNAGTDVPVIAIDGQALPRTGSYGVVEGVPYRVVASVETLPLASDARATLLVSAQRTDVGMFRQNLVSRRPGPEVEAFLADGDVRFRSITTRGQQAASANFVVPTYSFGYLRWLGAVSMVTALAALLLYLASQRATRELGALMTRRMGLTANRMSVVTAIEVLSLVAIASITALIVTPALVGAILPRFDPAPTLPPDLDPQTPWGTAVLTILGLLLICGFSVWLAERLSSRRPDAVILREQS